MQLETGVNSNSETYKEVCLVFPIPTSWPMNTFSSLETKVGSVWGTGPPIGIQSTYMLEIARILILECQLFRQSATSHVFVQDSPNGSSGKRLECLTHWTWSLKLETMENLCWRYCWVKQQDLDLKRKESKRERASSVYAAAFTSLYRHIILKAKMMDFN